jgi:hypothetical protein
MAGFTTVQSLGGQEDLDLRDAVNRWQIPGPRILTSIAQISRQSLTPDSLRGWVRALKAQGADVIKVFASAGLQNGGSQTLSDEQLAAVCGEAKAQGLRSVVHAISAGSVRAATLAGCTEIEHGTFATEAELKLMAEHGTVFDPQVCLVFQNYVDHREVYGRSGYTEQTFQSFIDALPAASAMFKRAITTPGLTVIFGTDAVALAHGRNADELLCRDEGGSVADGRHHLGDVGRGEGLGPRRQARRDRPGFRRGHRRDEARSVEGHCRDERCRLRHERRRRVRSALLIASRHPRAQRGICTSITCRSLAVRSDDTENQSFFATASQFTVFHQALT